MIKNKFYFFLFVCVTFLNSATINNECKTAKVCTEKGVQFAINLDNQNAAIFYKKGCEGNDLRGCTNLGVFYEKGVIFEKDIQKASQLYLKSCDQNYARACTDLADLYQNNSEKFAINSDSVKKLYEKGCEGKHNRGCFQLANLYESNNQKKSIDFYKQSCDSGYAESCSKLGIFYTNGKYIEENKTTAIKYFDKGCKLKDKMSCSSFAYLTILEDPKNKPDYNKAYSILSNYCFNENVKDSCNNLAVMYEYGIGIEKNIEKAENLYKK